VEYLADLIGVENVSLGLDLVDNKPMDQYEVLYADDPNYPDPPWSYPTGITHASEIPNITAELVDRGFGEDEIRGILGENLLRVYEDVWSE